MRNSDLQKKRKVIKELRRKIEGLEEENWKLKLKLGRLVGILGELKAVNINKS